MDKIWSDFVGVIYENPVQYFVFLAISIIILVLTAITNNSNRNSFRKYFGKIYPIVAVLSVILIGLFLFTFLLLDDQFAIFQSGNIQGILYASSLAVPFAVLMIFIDRKAPFPVDINVPYPDSLFFYPVMGFVVEILFHILPFCLIYFIGGVILGELSNLIIIWTGILVIALLEPIFQIVFTKGDNAKWVLAFMGILLFLFNVTQLLLFLQFDFITMYLFRLVYYILWHIIWGSLRVKFLFTSTDLSK